MLKIAIESGYNDRYKAKDVYGARYYMQGIFKKNDIELTRVSITKFKKNKQCFSEYNKFTETGGVTRIKSDYKPDIIWNKKGNSTRYKYKLLEAFSIICSQHIAVLANDKYETYMFLQKYQPKTFLLSTVIQNRYIQKKYPGPMIVKPIRASGGN